MIGQICLRCQQEIGRTSEIWPNPLKNRTVEFCLQESEWISGSQILSHMQKYLSELYSEAIRFADPTGG